jgi:sirohydrochlorin ferrochelatase
MERRSGTEYAFNGALLEEMLERIGKASQPIPVIVAMQFIGPGRHAGSGGDVVSICQQAKQRYPELSIRISSLVGEDDTIVDILADRARAALPSPGGVEGPET